MALARIVPAFLQTVRQRSLRIAAGILLALFAVVVFAAWAGLPALIRWGLETKAAVTIGRDVSVGKVSFNPFTLTARIESLRIASADGKSALLSVAVVNANLSALSAWYRGPVLDSLQIEQPALHFARVADSRYSFNDIIERLQAQPKTASGEPVRFSINNIELHGGRIDFDDQPLGKHHQVENIQLGVPFISNLPARIHLSVAPQLDARINGSAMHLAGQLKPFDNDFAASLDVRLASFDLTHYLAYSPAKLPVRVDRGELTGDLHLLWGPGEKGAQRFSMKGSVGLNKLAMSEPDGAPLLGLESLALDIGSFEPLAIPMRGSISLLRLDAPELHVRRQADGRVNVAELFAGQSDSASPPARPAITLAAAEVNKGVLHWQDQAVPGAYALSLQPISLRLRGLAFAEDKAASLTLSTGGEEGEQISFTGEINLLRAAHHGHLALKGVQLASLRPYYQSHIGAARMQGAFEAEADLEFAADPLQIKLSQGRAGLRNLAMQAPGTRKPLVEVPEVLLEGVGFDLAARELGGDKLTLTGARWAVSKGEKGRIDLLELLQPAPPAVTAVASAGPDSSEVAPAWKLRLGETLLSDWRVHFEDHTGVAPVSLDLRDLGMRVSDWRNTAGHRADVTLSAKVNRAGQVKLSGRVSSEPLQGQLQADIRDVDLLAIQPYVAQHFNVLVTRGHASSKGRLDFDLADASHPDIRFAGDLAINEFSSLDRINDTDFLQWRNFSVTGATLQLDPLVLSARELHLDDFYSRLILDAQGRFNLRELAATDQTDASEKPAESASPGSPLQIRLDRLSLSGGTVDYSDRFVKPNYDAKLAAVNGVLTGLSSDPKTVAQLDLNAAVDGAAPVQVAGQLNLLRQDRFMDIGAQVKGIDLTSASTYAAKYVGYGIEKGTLSMKLKYQIQDRKLSADNQIYLDQLTFGKRVESPDATKLPVLFAVALLKNRNGEIDINLPISGSLDDPEFSVGGIVVKVIVNLVTKAVTAPFALIGSMFGGSGGEELSYLDFVPGKAELSTAAIEKLQALAKALTDRPALRLDISGQTDPARDLDGVNHMRLDERLRALKAERLVKTGESVADVDALVIQASESPGLLAEVYALEKIADKPRNALGIAKAIPFEDMEKLLLNHFAKDAPDLPSLAARRARAVRDWLVTQGKVSPERVFLLATEQRAAVGNATPEAAPRVLFSLK